MAKGRSKSATPFSLIQGGFEYRNKEDITTLPPNTMVVGSQNVLTNEAGRIGVRPGYSLDGSADTSISSILASYDYEMHTGSTRNLRGGFLTSAGNDGKLQYRYVDSSGTVTWRDLLSSQTSTYFQFCNYGVYSSTAFLTSLCLIVNRGSNLWEWTGGVTTVTGGTINTITKSGTATWAAEGFYTTGTHSVTINGVDYQATGGWGTTTLTGVSPSAAGLSNGDIAHQTPESTNLSSITGLPSANFTADLISSLQGRVYYGSLTNQNVYVSKSLNYKDCSFSSPPVVGDGRYTPLDGPVVAFVPQDDAMYFSAGKDQWYKSVWAISTSGTQVESFTVNRLKTGVLQGAISQGLSSKLDNKVIYLSNEQSINSLGFVDNILQTPQITNISFPIVNDVANLDFTDGQITNLNEMVYISAPVESKVFIYNMSDPQNPYWEAPQILPIGRFSIIDGELYGHSYQTSETYKLFDGYNDNGNQIQAVAKFAFDSHSTSDKGYRARTKYFNEYFVEGYISSNTTLALGLQYDIDGCATETSYTIDGTDSRIVCIGSQDNSLGKFALGKQPLGGNLDQTSSGALPPKFRVIKTFTKTPYFEYQPSFSSQGIDQQWEILAFGPAWRTTAENEAFIKE